MTLQFISALLRASPSEQERFYARQLPIGVFATDEAQIRWVYEYRAQRGVYPSITAFQSRFHSVELPETDATLSDLTQTIAEADSFRQLTDLVDKARDMHESGRSIKDTVEFFRRATQDIRLYDSSFSDVYLSSKQDVKNYREFVRQKNKGLIKAPSPWFTFNEAIGLFLPGELATIAARTSLGKTWCAISWADHFRNQGERVLLISKELPSRQIALRWGAITHRLSYPNLRKGLLDPAALARWVRSSRKPESKDVLISGTETIKGVGFSHIIQKIQEFNPTVLIVDGAYLIYPEEKFTNDVQRFAFISSMLKRISMTYQLKTIAVVQAKREAEADTISGVTKAGITHIYGADTWAQDSDIVLMLNGKRGSTVRTLSLEKAREGEVASWTINFKLDPYPDFAEVVSSAEASSNKVEFKGV